MAQSPKPISKKQQAQIEIRRRRVERDLASKLKKLQSYGIYEPSSNALTKDRKTKIRKLWQQHKDNITNPRVAFVKIPKTQEFRKRGLLKKLKGLKVDTTDKGFFIEKGGQRKVKLVRNVKTHEFEIIKSGKIKWGSNKGKHITEIIPIASLNDITNNEQRLREYAANLPKLQKNQRLGFKIVQDGREAFSKTTHSNVEDVIRRLREYQKTPLNQVNFYRHIEIEVTTIKDWHEKRVQAKQKRIKRKVNKTGRN